MNSRRASVSEELMRLAAIAGVRASQVRHQLLVVGETTLTTAAAATYVDLLEFAIEPSRCMVITSMDIESWPEDATAPLLGTKSPGFYYEDYGLFFQLAGQELAKQGANPRFFEGEVFYVFEPGTLKLTVRVPVTAPIGRKLHVAARLTTFQLPIRTFEALAMVGTIRGN